MGSYPSPPATRNSSSFLNTSSVLQPVFPCLANRTSPVSLNNRPNSVFAIRSNGFEASFGSSLPQEKSRSPLLLAVAIQP